LTVCKWHWRWSPLNSSQNISYEYYRSYQNKQLHLNGNWQISSMIRLEQMKKKHLCLMIVEGQWNAVHCLIIQILVQNDKWTMEELLHYWLLIGLRSNQLWHTLCELWCSSKVFWWKTIYSDFPWILMKSNQSR